LNLQHLVPKPSICVLDEQAKPTTTPSHYHLSKLFP
jgi:hypothetical protein